MEEQYCAPNCSKVIAPEMGEIFSDLTAGTIGVGVGGATARTTIITTTAVLKQGVNGNVIRLSKEAQRICAVAASLCVLSKTPAGKIVLQPTDDVIRVVRVMEEIRRRSSIKPPVPIGGP